MRRPTRQNHMFCLEFESRSPHRKLANTITVLAQKIIAVNTRQSEKYQKRPEKHQQTQI